MESQQGNPLQKYFRQPKVYLKLPSNGKWYPDESLEFTESGEFPVYAMTARDEIMIKTPDALINGEATTSVIESCIPNIKNAWHVPLIDLDAILLAIRIATYGETMTISVNTPVTGEEKDFDVNLQQLLDDFYSKSYNDVVELPEMRVSIRPLSYKEFTETSLKTFEEQRLFAAVSNENLPESEKLNTFNKSFRKLTEITIFTLEKSIVSIDTDSETVTNPNHIKEFVENADKNMFQTVTEHIETERNKFSVQPLKVEATEEEVNQGVPQTYEVPISFDQANFFE
jgi:hypothetical protein